MIQQDVVDALNERLAAFPDAPEIAWEDSGYEVRDGVAYLSPRLSSYTSYVVGGGVDGATQVDGTYTVVVRRPADEGRQPAGHLAGAIEGWFGRGVPIVAAGVPVILSQATELAATISGNWISIPVQVTFTALF